jgi:1-acyl-sn-glycerol-3-phosphate acyltransferase
MIRGLWVAFIAVLYCVLDGVPIVWRGYRRSPKSKCTCRHNPGHWARKVASAANVEVTLEGAEHLSTERPAVLVANHQSWMDVIALLGYLPVDTRFVIKKELEKVPLFGQCFMTCGHISVDRRDRQAAIESLQRAGKLMREERPTIIMFAEGTRSATGELQPFKKGPFVLALETGVPIVPAAIIGTREVMRKHSLRVRPGPVRVRIGAPIPVEGLGSEDRDALTAVAHDAVAKLKAGAPVQGPWQPLAKLPKRRMGRGARTQE